MDKYKYVEIKIDGHIYPMKGFAALINDRVYHDFPTDYMLREKKNREYLPRLKRKGDSGLWQTIVC